MKKVKMFRTERGAIEGGKTIAVYEEGKEYSVPDEMMQEVAEVFVEQIKIAEWVVEQKDAGKAPQNKAASPSNNKDAKLEEEKSSSGKVSKKEKAEQTNKEKFLNKVRKR